MNDKKSSDILDYFDEFFSLDHSYSEPPLTISDEIPINKGSPPDANSPPSVDTKVTIERVVQEPPEYQQPDNNAQEIVEILQMNKEIQRELVRQMSTLRYQVSELQAELEKSKEREEMIANTFIIQDDVINDKSQTQRQSEKLQISDTSTRVIDKKKLMKGKIIEIVKEALFYLLLISIVFSAFFIKSNADGKPIVLAGYSAFLVKTGSMEAEMPKGSLVITKRVDPKTLEIGDDITFMANQTTTVTHRIIGITENYKNTGQRAFETQGIMNKNPDKNPVPTVNVVGKVIFHSEILGLMAGFMSKNWPLLVFWIFVSSGLYYFLKYVYKSPPDDRSEKEGKPRNHGNCL